MNRIGILGGMSWRSTECYYRTICSLFSENFGSQKAPQIVINSVDADIPYSLLKKNDLDGFQKFILRELLRLENSGVDILAIACNTAHICYEEIISKISVPVIHIAQSVTDELKLKSIKKVTVLGTRETILYGVYENYLTQAGILALYPSEIERKFLQKIIYQYCATGCVDPQLQIKLNSIIGRQLAIGSQGIILGCTELRYLVSPSDILLFDSTAIHAQCLVNVMLQNVKKTKWNQTA